MNMKATNWIKAGFCLYIGWELSRALDHILGAHYMDTQDMIQLPGQLPGQPPSNVQAETRLYPICSFHIHKLTPPHIRPCISREISTLSKVVRVFE